MNQIKSVILGFEGEKLTSEEKEFFKEVNPLGFILFSRNCKSKEQIADVVNELKSLVRRDNLIITIDQEGGRVARLPKADFYKFPPASIFADLAKQDLNKAKEAVYLNALLIAANLAEVGVNCNCAPVADLLFDGAHSIIGDRSYGTDPDVVISLAHSMAAGLTDGGIIPILKHIPGHGRAKLDSHEDLPIIDEDIETLEKTDFKVFKALAHIPIAMTAHLVFSKMDPQNPVTTSSKMIEYIRNDIGYNNVLITDDLSMKALKGSFEDRARLSIEAGCDILLHCNGNMGEMKSVVKFAPLINDRVTNLLKHNIPKNHFDIHEDKIITKISRFIEWQYKAYA